MTAKSHPKNTVTGVPAGEYTRRPTNVHAFQWTGDNFDQLRDWALTHGLTIILTPSGSLHLYVSLEDTFMIVPVWHVIATPEHGRAHPVEPAQFRQTYNTAVPVINGYSGACLDGEHMDCSDRSCGCRFGTHMIAHRS